MKYEMVDPKRLEPSAYNPRKISAEEFAKLRASIREFGLVQPLILQIPGNRIIAGHQRRDAAIAEGLTRVPVTRLRISDAKAKAMNLALNRISGEWDDEKLKDLLASLELIDWDKEIGHLPAGTGLAITGFDSDEIAKLLEESIEGASPIVSLADKFIVPPFSVLDARQGYWQERKRAWLALGIRGEVGRGENLQNMSESTNSYRYDKKNYFARLTNQPANQPTNAPWKGGALHDSEEFGDTLGRKASYDRKRKDGRTDGRTDGANARRRSRVKTN